LIDASSVVFGDRCSIIVWSSILFLSSNFKFGPLISSIYSLNSKL
jgi:hypothetical protein